MSVQITTAFVSQFQDNIQLLSQQMDNRFRMNVRQETQEGETEFYEQIGATTAVELEGRHEDTPRVDTPHSRRRVTTRPIVWADLIDKADRVRTLVDPTSAYVRNASAAMARKIDDIIIAEFFATAFTGKAGGTSTTFPGSQQVAAGGTNLTVAKLLDAKEILDSADVDPSIPRYCAATASQFRSLLDETEVKSSDFNTVKALVQGEIDTFLGFKFIQSQRLLFDSGVIRSVPCWAEDGMLVAVGINPQARVTEESTKNFSTQVHYMMDVGATRMEEVKVVQVLCDES